MASASSLRGLMAFLRHEEWRDAFEDIKHAHFFVACHNAGIETDEIADILGDQHAATLWGCAFEDFLARDLPGDRNMVDDYLKRRGYKETASAKAYMTAIRHSVMSLYEVSDIVPGQSFLARDLIRGGEPVRVIERSATTKMRPWERIGARIVPLSSSFQMCGGLLVYHLETSEKLMAKLRWFETRVEREMHAIADETGSRFDLGLYKDITANGVLLELAAPIFTRIWLTDALDRAVNPRLLELFNTDGDPILFCTQRFPLADGASLKAVRATLAAVDDLRQASDFFFNWIGPEVAASALPTTVNPSRVLMSTHSEGGAILGGVEITQSEVLVTANSRQRAERAKSMIATALDSLVGAPALETETQDEALARQERTPATLEKGPGLAIPPGGKRRIAHSLIDEHYRKTLDNGLAILNGMTPREAARTAAGRDKVAMWLKYLENQSHRGGDRDDPLATYDLAWMWSELGMAERRV